METSYLSVRLRQNLHMKKYLDELSTLTGHQVQVDELESLERTKKLQECSKKFLTNIPKIYEILFSEMYEDRFKAFIDRLNVANPSSVYVWTPNTIDCGVLLVKSISAIKFDFDFSINEDGILAFSTSDLEDRLLLDFSISKKHGKIIKIETQGSNWERVIY